MTSKGRRDDDVTRGLLRGAKVVSLTPEHSIRVFLSSTFTDTTVERNYFMVHVYPEIADWCRTNYAVDFRVEDMRWGVRDEMTNDWRTTDVCLDEILRCRQESIGLFFVTMVDQKKGFAPPPRTIEATELKQIFRKLSQQECLGDIDVINRFYALDLNARPETFSLRSITELYPNYWDQKSPTHKDEVAILWAGFDQLVSALRKGITWVTGDPECELAQKYFRGVTEIEIRTAFPHASTDSPIIWLRRHLDGLDDTTVASKETSKEYGKFCEYDVTKAGKGRHGQIALTRNLAAKQSVDTLHQFLLSQNQIVVRDIPPRVNFLDLISDEKTRSPAVNEYLETFAEHFRTVLRDSIENSMRIPRESFIQDELLLEIRTHLHISQHLAITEVDADYSVVQDPSKFRDKLVVIGPVGSGKSTWCATLASLKSQLRDSVTVIRFCGATPSSSRIASLLSSIAEQLLRYVDLTSNTNQSSFSKDNEKDQPFSAIVCRWLYALEKVGKLHTSGEVTIILDGLDKLVKDEDLLGATWIPTTLPDGIGCFIMSYGSDINLASKLESATMTLFSVKEIKSLRVPQILAALSRFLKRYFNRKISATQVRAIQGKLDSGVGHPVAFAALLAHMAAFWRSDVDVVNINFAKNAGDAAIDILHKIETEHHLLAQTALPLLTASRYGLTDGEMDDLLSMDSAVIEDVCQYHKTPAMRMPPLLWTRLRQSLEGFLVSSQQAGVVSCKWFQRHLQNAANERYLTTDTLRLKWHRALIAYFETHDPLSSRVLLELPWHLAECAATEGGVLEATKLGALLSNVAVFSILLVNHPFDLRRYWAIAAEADSKRLRERVVEECCALIDDDSQQLSVSIARVLLYVGDDALHKGDYSSARGIFEIVLKQRQPLATIRARRSLALIEMRLGNFAASLAEVELAEDVINALSPDSKCAQEFIAAMSDLKLHQAHVLGTTGQNKEAVIVLESIQDSLEFDPLKKAQSMMRLAYAKFGLTSVRNNDDLIDKLVIAPFNESIALAERYHDKHLAVDIKTKRVMVLGQIKKASYADYDSVIKEAASCGNKYVEAFAVYNKGMFALNQKGDKPYAISILRTAISKALENSEARVLETARTALTNALIPSSQGWGYMLQNYPQLSTTEESSVFGCLQKDVEIPSDLCSAFSSSDNIRQLNRLMDLAASDDSKYGPPHNIAMKEDITMNRLVDLLAPVHSCRSYAIKKIAASRAILAPSRIHGDEQPELEKIIIALMTHTASLGFWAEFGWGADAAELSTEPSEKCLHSLTPSFGAAVLFLVWRMRFNVYGDGGDYELSVMRRLHFLATETLSVEAKKLFDISSTRLLETLNEGAPFNAFKYDFGYSLGRRQGSISSGVGELLPAWQIDRIFAILGPNTHYGGASIIINPKILSHEWTSLSCPSVAAIDSAQPKKSHPFLFEATDPSSQLKPSQFLFNASTPGWSKALSRVIGASGRLHLDGMDEEDDEDKEEPTDSQMICWYHAHDVLFQREFNIEAQLPPVIPASYFNHILIDESIADAELLELLKNCRDSTGSDLLSRTLIFKTEAERIKWQQVYQSCDVSVINDAPSRKVSESITLDRSLLDRMSVDDADWMKGRGTLEVLAAPQHVDIALQRTQSAAAPLSAVGLPLVYNEHAECSHAEMLTVGSKVYFHNDARAGTYNTGCIVDEHYGVFKVECDEGKERKAYALMSDRLYPPGSSKAAAIFGPPRKDIWTYEFVDVRKEKESYCGYGEGSCSYESYRLDCKLKFVNKVTIERPSLTAQDPQQWVLDFGAAIKDWDERSNIHRYLPPSWLDFYTKQFHGAHVSDKGTFYSETIHCESPDLENPIFFSQLPWWIVPELIKLEPSVVRTKSSNGMLPLHVHSAQKGNVLAVQTLLSAYPEGVRVKDYYGRPPLHLAASSEIATILLAAHPEAARVKDKDGGLPLHYACYTFEPSLALVEALLAAHPDAVREKRKNGYLPLHYACSKDSETSLALVQALLAAYPDAAKEKDVEGYLPLHLACVKGSERSAEVVQALLTAYPDAAREKCKKGSLPLHFALGKSQPSFEIVQALFDVFPEAARKKCKDGYLPLHHACDASDQFLSMAQQLLAFYPEAAREKSKAGYLPLHYASVKSLQLVQALLAVYPEAAREKCKNGLLPLQHALRKSQPSVAIVQALLAAHPEAARVKDKDGGLPLQEALGKSTPSLALVEALLAAHPDAVREKRKNGYLPLHYACSKDSETSLALVQALLAAYPDAAKEKDVEGYLPLHLACVKGSERSAEVVQALLTAYPDAAREKCKKGSLPLHFACGSNTITLAIVEALLSVFPEGVRETYNGNLALHLVCVRSSPSLDMVLRLLTIFPEAATKKGKGGKLSFEMLKSSAPRSIMHALKDAAEYIPPLPPVKISVVGRLAQLRARIRRGMHYAFKRRHKK